MSSHSCCSEAVWSGCFVNVGVKGRFDDMTSLVPSCDVDTVAKGSERVATLSKRKSHTKPEKKKYSKRPPNITVR